AVAGPSCRALALRWLAVGSVPSAGMAPLASVAAPLAWAMASKTLAALLRLACAPNCSRHFLPSLPRPGGQLPAESVNLGGELDRFGPAAGQLFVEGCPAHRFAPKPPIAKRSLEEVPQAHLGGDVAGQRSELDNPALAAALGVVVGFDARGGADHLVRSPATGRRFAQ